MKCKIIVTGIPRTGTSFVMSLLGALGWRIPIQYDEQWGGGHETNLFPIFHCGNFPLLERAFLSPSLLRTMGLSNSFQYKCNWKNVFDNFDAIKILDGGYILATMCIEGFSPDLVVICYRDFVEIEHKYGPIHRIIPNNISTYLPPVPAAPYMIYGYINFVVTWFDIPTIHILYPDFAENKTYAYKKIGKFLNIEEGTFSDAWDKAQHV